MEYPGTKPKGAKYDCSETMGREEVAFRGLVDERILWSSIPSLAIEQYISKMP